MADSGYISDSAASFYQQLETLLDSGWGIRKKYDALRDAFKRAINQEVGLTNLNFSGTFAKLDYLIKEKGISEAESVRLHDTRRTLNTLSEISDRQLQDSIGSDVKSAAMLVEALSRFRSRCGVNCPSTTSHGHGASLTAATCGALSTHGTTNISTSRKNAAACR